MISQRLMISSEKTYARDVLRDHIGYGGHEKSTVKIEMAAGMLS